MSGNPKIRAGGTYVYAFKVTLDPENPLQKMIIVVFEKCVKVGVPFAVIARQMLTFAIIGICMRYGISHRLLRNAIQELDDSIGDLLINIIKEN